MCLRGGGGLTPWPLRLSLSLSLSPSPSPSDSPSPSLSPSLTPWPASAMLRAGRWMLGICLLSHSLFNPRDRL